jgi:hypothetical protein
VVDSARYFVPESFTPLFYTPLYARLTQEQRRRYNQLHGCYCNEQIMFFEKFVAENVLSGLLRTEEAGPLRSQLRAFLAEERRHAKMFYDLNQLCLPRLYDRKEFHFVIKTAEGREYKFPMLWTAVAQRDKGQWKALRMHGSIDPTDQCFCHNSTQYDQVDVRIGRTCRGR